MQVSFGLSVPRFYKASVMLRRGIPRCKATSPKPYTLSSSQRQAKEGGASADSTADAGDLNGDHSVAWSPVNGSAASQGKEGLKAALSLGYLQNRR